MVKCFNKLYLYLCLIGASIVLASGADDIVVDDDTDDSVGAVNTPEWISAGGYVKFIHSFLPKIFFVTSCVW
jgi:hypothetical protein